MSVVFNRKAPLTTCWSTSLYDVAGWLEALNYQPLLKPDVNLNDESFSKTDSNKNKIMLYSCAEGVFQVLVFAINTCTEPTRYIYISLVASL